MFQFKHKKGRNYGLYEFNSFIPNGISLYYQLEQSTSVLRDDGWYFFLQILIENDPDQTAHSEASVSFVYVPLKGRYAYMG